MQNDALSQDKDLSIHIAAQVERALDERSIPTTLTQVASNTGTTNTRLSTISTKLDSLSTQLSSMIALLEEIKDK